MSVEVMIGGAVAVAILAYLIIKGKSGTKGSSSSGAGRSPKEPNEAPKNKK